MVYLWKKKLHQIVLEVNHKPSDYYNYITSCVKNWAECVPSHWTGYKCKHSKISLQLSWPAAPEGSSVDGRALSESHNTEEKERDGGFRYPDCCLISDKINVKHRSYLMSFMSPTSSNGDIPKAWNWIVYGQRHDIMEVRPFLATPRKSFSLWSLWAVDRVTEMEWGEGRLETLRHNRKWKYGG